MLLATGFGMIEVTNLIFIEARIQSVAYESARLATRPTTSNSTAANNAQVVAYGQSLLAQLGINNATINVSPSNLLAATPGTLVTVAITAPSGSNSPTSYLLRNSVTLSAQTTLVVE
jgi:Flp pilus assembly protein TadG